MAKGFTVGSFFARWLFAAVLVFGTYNPTDYSYIDWILAESTAFEPIVAIVGIVLLIGWIVFLRATFMSMGWLGISLGAALFGCIIWLFVDLGWLSLDATGAISWIVLIILSLILATGMSWSHIRRRMSGQFDVDEVDD
ncbi:DUF6524 family protein [Marinobacter alexandrii]|uniref:DUF6524 family protein n=1 Tax=Marinobacter alexandrii TaxID=2570351 RepID=UPI003297D42F